MCNDVASQVVQLHGCWKMCIASGFVLEGQRKVEAPLSTYILSGQWTNNLTDFDPLDCRLVWQ